MPGDNLRDTGAKLNPARILITHGQLSGSQILEALNVGAAKGAAVGEIKASGGISYNGFREGAGTAFPTSPAPIAGDRFFRTDLGWLCFYDGTRWLTAHTYTIPEDFSSNNFAGTTLSAQVFVFRGGYAPYITRLQIDTYVAGANDGTNNWTVLFKGGDLAFAVFTTIHSFSTGTTPDAPATHTDHSTTTMSGTPTPSNNFFFVLDVTKNVAPANLNIFFYMEYRLIVT